MNIIFFDTETNGLPKKWSAPMTDLANWPRVIQLAWQVADSEGNLIHDEKHLIKPAGWTIPNEKFWIEHGFSTEINFVRGLPMLDVLELFLQHHNETEVMVAHNMDFDYNILGAEMLRYKMMGAKKNPKICTMKQSTDFVRVPYKHGSGWKFPKLEELYRFCFKEEMAGAHDAGNDVAATRLCFFELVKIGCIHLPKIEAA